MKTYQKNKLHALIIVFLMSIAMPLATLAQTVIDIQVSPNVLNLQNQGQVVTIHTDIPYSSVVGSSVTLNGEEIESWKADNQGYFVAKFNMDAIQGLESLVVDEYNTFTLIGLKTDGETFTGSEDILVINVLPKGKN